jgi:predicted RNase H-like HicB family nuclease
VTPANLHVDVHHEDTAYWAEVRELPGCFASGETVAELFASVEEAAQLYLAPKRPPLPPAPELVGLRLAVEASCRQRSPEAAHR